MITTRKHNQIVSELQDIIMDMTQQMLNLGEKKDAIISEHKKTIEYYRQKSEEASNLKEILNKLTDKTTTYAQSCNMMGELQLPDNILVYVDDIFGGKVIKQEGVKALKISKDGVVTTGLTKSKADKGYTYKLIRE